LQHPKSKIKATSMEAKMIGNKIAQARKNLNVSQAQLAERLFISPQAVGKWERGESVPDIITFSRLAEILGVDLNYFSESCQSAIPEVSTSALLVKPAGKPETAMPDNKLSWDMSRGNWVDADFSGLKNLHQKFSSSNMMCCKFIGSDMSGLLLKSNNVESCDFSGSDFSSSHIHNSHLSNNVFNNCSLKDTHFSGTYLSGCDFSGADLTGAIIKSGGLEKCNMTGAVLNNSCFNASSLADILFDGALENCYFENCSFKKVTFQNAMLTNTFFKDNNLKRIQFIDCQADRMTYEFLKSGKADLTGISLIAP
jgi:uncharacterized protein YjbI with pentapeptide repeats